MASARRWRTCTRKGVCGPPPSSSPCLHISHAGQLRRGLPFQGRHSSLWHRPQRPGTPGRNNRAKRVETAPKHKHSCRWSGRWATPARQSRTPTQGTRPSRRPRSWPVTRIGLSGSSFSKRFFIDSHDPSLGTGGGRNGRCSAWWRSVEVCSARYSGADISEKARDELLPRRARKRRRVSLDDGGPLRGESGQRVGAQDHESHRRRRLLQIRRPNPSLVPPKITIDISACGRKFSR